MDNNSLLTPNKIVKSNRKTLSLIINNNGELIVRAPIKHSEKQIYDFINKKANWIISKRIFILSKRIEPFNTSYKTLNILGISYDIVFYNMKSVKLLENKLYVPIENYQKKLIMYLKKIAKITLTTKVEYFSKQFGFKYQSISISSAKTNWGSCSYNNKLHFTYRLMLCPESVVDYIVIHELTHTQIKNHSSKFWLMVEKLYPNYKQCEKWLKSNKGIINII